MALKDQQGEEQELFGEIDEGVDERTELSRMQWLWLIGGGFLAFSVFFVALFPFEGIVRASVRKLLPPQSRLEFSTFRMGWIGQTKMDDFLYSSGPTMRLESENVVADLSKLSLLRFSPKGSVRFNNGSFSAATFGGSFKSLEIAFDLNDIRQPASQWEGQIQIRMQQLEPEELPPLLSMLPTTPDELSVSRISLPLEFRRGKLDFGQSQLQSSLFTVRLEGSGRVGGDLTTTALDGKVCLKPVDDLEERNAKLQEYYIMAGGTAGGELCMKVGGMLGSPSFTRMESAPPQ